MQLSVEHQFSESTSLFSVPVIASGLLLASAAWVVVRLIGWGRFPSAVLPLAWAIVALLPSSVVPLNVLDNEHRLYQPIIAAGRRLGNWRLSPPPGRNYSGH